MFRGIFINHNAVCFITLSYSKFHWKIDETSFDYDVEHTKELVVLFRTKEVILIVLGYYAVMLCSLILIFSFGIIMV